MNFKSCLALGFVTLTLLNSCIPKEEPEPAQVSTNVVTDITGTTATSGGTIITDGNSAITQRGVCWKDGLNPSLSDHYTVDGSGTGSFTSFMTGLLPNTQYYVSAYATNEEGTSYGLVQVFTTSGGSSGTVTDINGNTYNTIAIGSQIWMKENLKVKHYRNGDAIPYVSDPVAWNGLSTGGYCPYDNLQGNGDTYGELYNWFAIEDSRNVAPTGWHVPSYNEWQTLITQLGGASVAGGKLKETGTLHWSSPNNATNESNFTALGTGLRDQDGTYFAMGLVTYWWSSTVSDPVYSWGCSIPNDQTTIFSVVYDKRLGFPVRCVKD